MPRGITWLPAWDSDWLSDWEDRVTDAMSRMTPEDIRDSFAGAELTPEEEEELFRSHGYDPQPLEDGDRR